MAVIFPQDPTPGQVFLPQGSSIGYTWTGTFWNQGVVAFTPTGSLELVVSYVPGTAVAGTVNSATTASYLEGVEFFNAAAQVGVLGTETTLDNITAKISSTGNTSIQLKTVSGGMTVDGMQPGGFNTVNQVTRVQGLELTTVYTYINAETNLSNPGDSQVFTFVDRSSGASYRVTGLVSQGFSKNLISIEKLV
jgi:hypothetical protein